MEEKRSGCEELRLIVSNMDVTREDFNSRYSLEELIKIYRAFLACDWDIYPDEWTDRQVKDALAGIPPKWDADLRPVYESRRKA